MADSNDIDKRVLYFTNQLLTEQDMTAEQAYHLDRERRLIRAMYTPGIVSGLDLALAEAGKIVVKAGTAIDASGRQIVVTADRTLTLVTGDPQADHADTVIPFPPRGNRFPQAWLLTMAYYEAKDTLSTTSAGSQGSNRILEAPAFHLLQEGAPGLGADYLVLGKLSLSVSDNNGVSIGALVADDQRKVRVYAGMKFDGQLTVSGAINYFSDPLPDAPLSVRIPDPNLVAGSDGTVTINPPATALRLSREGVSGKSWQDIAEFRLSRFDINSYSSPDAKTQLDIALTSHDRNNINTVLSLRCDGSVSVAGETITNRLSVANTTNLQGGTTIGTRDSPSSLTVLGTSNLSGGATIDTNLTVTGRSRINGEMTVNDSPLTVTGSISVSPNTNTKYDSKSGAPTVLAINGNSKLNGAVDVTGSTSLSGPTTLKGGTIIEVNGTDYLRLKRPPSTATSSEKAVFLELFQESSSVDTFPSIRFNDNNRYWHRIEAKPSGIYFYEGDTGTDNLINIYASNAIVSGMILMWHGLTSTIPAGWYLCDGNNGTPDLQNKFIRGMPSGFSDTATRDGGSDTHAHTVFAPNSDTPTFGRVEGSWKFSGVTHTHNTSTEFNLPKYFLLAFIMKS